MRIGYSYHNIHNRVLKFMRLTSLHVCLRELRRLCIIFHFHLVTGINFMQIACKFPFVSLPKLHKIHKLLQWIADPSSPQTEVSKSVTRTSLSYVESLFFTIKRFDISYCLSIGPFRNDNPPSCTCQNTEPAKQHVPKDELEDLQRRRAEEYRQHQIRCMALSRWAVKRYNINFIRLKEHSCFARAARRAGKRDDVLLLAPSNTPLQYPIRGFRVMPLNKTLIPGEWDLWCLLIDFTWIVWDHTNKLLKMNAIVVQLYK